MIHPMTREAVPSQFWYATIGDVPNGNYIDIDTSGQILLYGDARITVDDYVSASGVKAPGAKPAVFVLLGLAGAWRFSNEAVAGNQKTISGTLKLPTEMDKTVPPVFKVGWSAAGVSPGNAKWQLEYVYRGLNDATDAVAQETLDATMAASATANGLIITPFMGMDLPATADQAMFFKITRLSASGDDTIADNLELRGMLFTHTVDKLGTPV